MLVSLVKSRSIISNRYACLLNNEFSPLKSSLIKNWIPSKNQKRHSTGKPPVSTCKLLQRYNKKFIVEAPATVSAFKEQEDRAVTKRSGEGSKQLNKKIHIHLPRGELTILLKKFEKNSSIKEIISSLGISPATFDKLTPQFTVDLLKGNISYINYENCAEEFSKRGAMSLDRYLASCFIRYALPLLSNSERNKLDYYRNIADLSNPAAWFPKARRMKRKIIMHVGPTNSGKTYRALQKLGAAQRGLYCGPLRLLAYEIWKKFLDQGIQCDLVTGEERITSEQYFEAPQLYNMTSTNVEASVLVKKPINIEQRLVAATVEMASVNSIYDVAVLDEIQMIGDEQRGWGWARAVIGLQAREIHLCGEASAVPIVRELCKELHDDFEVNEYKRLSPLEISKNSLRGFYKNIQPGDCIVTFSRKSIFIHKEAVERITGLRCAVVYGRLPPENRANQARLFNDPDSPYKVMIASDAVGMGLNLNIRRVIFDSLEKFDGVENILIPAPQVKQIAGRAGRFQTAYANGVALAFSQSDVAYLHLAMSKQPKNIKRIGLQPEAEVLKLFCHQFPNDSFSQILAKYSILASLNPRYFMSFSDAHYQISNVMLNIPLSIQDRYSFLMAPFNPRDRYVTKFFLSIVEKHSRQEIVLIDDIIKLPSLLLGKVPPEYLAELETFHKCIMLYLWLSFRFPQTLTDLDRCQSLKVTAEKRLHTALTSVRQQDTQTFLKTVDAAKTSKGPQRQIGRKFIISNKTIY